jgi:hypothetical protein
MKVGVGTDRRSLFSRRVGTAGAQAFRIRLLEDSLTNDAVIDFYMGNGSSADVQTFSYKFRDHSAWYHCVVTFDTTNAIIVDRLKFTVNGVRQTDTLAYANLDSDTNYVWNTANEHNIGRQVVENDNWMDGYMAEIVFIDGTAHDATDFGEYTSNGIWIPKNIHDQSFTFGTNGFYLTGQDASNLGYDYQTSNRSGTTNDWTSNNFAAHDQVADSPTNNFCVINPLNTNSSVTISNGNLQSTASAFTGSGASILLPTTGKWYCEFRYNSGLNNEYPVVGVYNTIKNLTTTAVSPGKTSGDLDIGFGIDGRRNEDDTNTASWGNSVTNGKIGALAIDMTNKKIWFGHNNSGSFVWQASGDPSAGTNEANTKDFADDLIFGNSHFSSSNLTWNFGQDGTFAGTETAQGNADANGVGNFYYAPPTGYLALCTKNLGAD